MIYIFRGFDDSCSIVRNIKGMTGDKLQKACKVVESLPPCNTPSGHIAQLMFNPEDKSIYWDYIEIEEESEEESQNEN